MVNPLTVDKEFKDLITPLAEDEYKGLEQNIIERGCLDNIKTWEGIIIDGHNRYEICEKHNLPFGVTELLFSTREEVINWIIDNQLGRRNLTPWQMSVLRGKRYKKEIQQGARNDLTSRQNGEMLSTSERLADQYGVSERTIQRDGDFYKAAERAAEETETPLMQLTKQQILNAAKEIQAERREAKRTERVEVIVHEAAELSSVGRHHVILADPPWRYDYSPSTSRDIENQYPTMEIDEICTLSVRDICADDCVLFLWSTSPKLQEAMLVMQSWGFEYKTCMVWVKDKIGMGYYARQQHELLLIGAKGNLPTPEPRNRPSSVIYGDREDHSKKPVTAYEIIEEMYSEFKKIELFCREPRKGWSVWGNQV